MKKIIVLISLLALVLCVQAQNLSFNRVVTFAGEVLTNSSSGDQDDGPLYTVPDGKIWKIEALYMSNYTGRLMNYKLNGILLKFNNVDPLNMIQFPIWLQAGDTVQPSANGSGEAVGFFISILEFNQP